MSGSIDDIIVPLDQDDDNSILSDDDHGEVIREEEKWDDSDEEEVETAMNKPGAADDKDESTGDTRTKKKKKVKKSGLIDLTPPDELLRQSHKAAKNFTNSGKNDAAIRELVKCMALARIVYGDGHWQLALAHNNLAQGYIDLKGYAPQAELHCNTALKVMSSAKQTQSSPEVAGKIKHSLINIYYIHGRALAMLKKFPESEKSFLRSESLYADWVKSVYEEDNNRELEIKITIALAKVSLLLNKHAAATRYYERALDLVKDSRGRNSQELIPIYQGLGKVELSKGRLGNAERAVTMFDQAHTICSSNNEAGSVAVAKTGRTLADAYSTVGGPAAESSAESYLNECLTIYLSHHGPNHETTIDTKDELAKLLLRGEKYEDGIRELKSSLASKQALYGDMSEEVCETRKLLANVHLAQGNMDLALKHYRQCLSVESATYGQNHRRAKELQASIDMILASPKFAGKQPKDDLKERPRFNSIVSRSK